MAEKLKKRQQLSTVRSAHPPVVSPSPETFRPDRHRYGTRRAQPPAPFYRQRNPVGRPSWMAPRPTAATSSGEPWFYTQLQVSASGAMFATYLRARQHGTNGSATGEAALYAA
jgi:hypothetical protein